ncbi:MAG: DUF932 domain-containing protein [Candidatus Riflebacteria bacterium]|nr:DUF932 domain-containing protein [Candidatus Riflebacteria bacterium]
MRVPNSYNALRALSFDIGFYRKVCRNGLILPENVIKYRFAHVRREIGETIEFDVDHEKLKNLKSSFNELLGKLRNCAVPHSTFVPFIRGVLCLKEPSKPDNHNASEWAELSVHIGEMNKRYASELGENAYAVFNVLTEFASHPPVNHFVRRNRHSMQRIVGTWLNEFSRECVKESHRS